MWAIAAARAEAPVTAASLAGDWHGTLAAGAVSARLELHLEPAGDALGGTLGIPGQGSGWKLAGSATGGRVTFTVPAIGAVFTGAPDPDGGLAGSWIQNGERVPLVFERGAAPAARRPQDPVPPFPYTTRELGVDVLPGVHLAGTWTQPPGPGPFPTVVLVTGSGPQDRDEALLGHRPFAVLADALARVGVASFRYDDRGVGASTGDFAAATTRDFATDAAAATAAVDALPESGAVGILGHSEGGLVAALVGDRAKFLILLAGPGVPGRVVVESQVAAMVRASGGSPAQVEAARAAQVRILDAVVAGGDVVAALAKEGLPGTQAPGLTTAWYRTFLTLDPAPALASLRIPVLALLGEKDLQVVASENEPALAKALAGNAAGSVVTLPGLNHLFQPAGTGLVDEYATIETTIDPAVLERIGAWVLAHGR